MNSKAKMLPQRRVQFEPELTPHEEKDAKRQVIADFWKWYHSRLSVRCNLTEEEAYSKRYPQQYYEQQQDLYRKRFVNGCTCPCHYQHQHQHQHQHQYQYQHQHPHNRNTTSSSDLRTPAASLMKLSKSSGHVSRAKSKERRTFAKSPSTTERKPSTLGRKSSTHKTPAAFSTRITKSVTTTQQGRTMSSVRRTTSSTTSKANETVNKIRSYAGEMHKRYQSKGNGGGNSKSNNGSSGTTSTRANSSRMGAKQPQTVVWQNATPGKEKPLVGILKKRY